MSAVYKVNSQRHESIANLAQTSVSVVEYSYSQSSSSSTSGIGAVDCFAKGLPSMPCGVAPAGPPMGKNAPMPPNMSITVCDLDEGIVADTVRKTWSTTGRGGEILLLGSLIRTR